MTFMVQYNKRNHHPKYTRRNQHTKKQNKTYTELKLYISYLCSHMLMDDDRKEIST